MVEPDTLIAGAEIVAGHDGAAELVIRLKHADGGERPVVLDGPAGFDLMRRCGVARAQDLTGQSWRRLLEEAKECST